MTNQNREEFVGLYLDYILNSSVRDRYHVFVGLYMDCILNSSVRDRYHPFSYFRCFTSADS